MPDSAGWILVGGKSSRFGRDKALAEWRGRPLALRVADAVRAAAGSATLVGNPEKYAALGLPVIPDAVRDAGPVGGLLAALCRTRARWNLVVACDMPCLSEVFLRFLLDEASRRGADVVLPLDAAGLPQPLCAVYAAAARETIQTAVKKGERKLMRAVEGLRLEQVPARDHARFDRTSQSLANVNRPEDLDDL